MITVAKTIKLFIGGEFPRTESGRSFPVLRHGSKNESVYAQLCLAYYLVGPDWLCEVAAGRRPSRDLPNLEGQTVRLTWAWRPETRAWLVLAGEPRHPDLRKWAERFPAFSFPKAEGAILRRLDPALREAALAAVR